MSDGVIHLAPIVGREDDIFGSGISFFNGRASARGCVDD